MRHEQAVRNKAGEVVGYITHRELGGWWAYRLWDHQSKLVPLSYLAVNFCLEK
jgi:hypothetical protein